LWGAHCYLSDVDEPPPTKEMRHVINYCYSRKKQLNLECDANAHHILWGSTGTSARGEALMEYLVSLNLNILNQGNEHTFMVCKRKEVINLTLGTNKISNPLNKWHVSDEMSLLDHRYICFLHVKWEEIKLLSGIQREPNGVIKGSLRVYLQTLS
jgi:hypothetical protein